MSLVDLPSRVLRRGLVWLGAELLRVQAQVARSTLPQFANSPKNLIIELPRRILNPECISWGDNVRIGPGAFINAARRYPSRSRMPPHRPYEPQTFSPCIQFGHRVSSSGSLVIGAAQRVTIGDDVMLAGNVTILDNLHGFAHIDEPYKYQALWHIAPVHVRRGCWIGQNVVILPGVEIGEMSIVGANSVVTESLPDRVIAVGAPARVIKRWDYQRQAWVSCSPRACKT
jgi:acetyltransferase-like isoleucine patch superfamily enzyme